MKLFKHLYKSFDLFEEHLSDAGFDLFSNCIVEIYTAGFSKEEAVLNAKLIKERLPNSQIFGISASGVVYNGEQYDDDTLVIVKKYDSTHSFVTTHIWENKTVEMLVDEIDHSLRESNPQMLNIVFSDHFVDIDKFVMQFNAKNSHVKLAGGQAGDILTKDIFGYVFTDDGIIDNGVIINALCGDVISCYCAANFASEAISPVYTVTETADGFWHEIENRPAIEWINEHFGIYEMLEYDNYEEAGVTDPFTKLLILLEGHRGSGRFLKFNKSHDKISEYFTTVLSGTSFRIGYTSPIKNVQRCHEICNEIAKTSIEDLFFYSCLFRKMYRENMVKWDLLPFHNSKICGAFLLGEIASIDGINEYLNGSCVFVGTAENKNHIIPDMSAFNDLDRIEDKNGEILDYILKKQIEIVRDQNKDLLVDLLDQQKIAEEQLYTDSNIGIYNLLRYQKDVKTHNFDKLCLVHIDNLDVLIAYLGYDLCYNHIKEEYQKIDKYVSSCKSTENLYPYFINSNTFAIATNSRVEETYFLEIIATMYEKFQLITIHNTSIPVVNKFIVSFNEGNLLESALNVLRVNENSHKRYFLCNEIDSQKKISSDEFKILTLLNYALENDGIVPYYQGIYDNKEKRITKYEALMRLVDIDGNVYTPIHFMDVAKKYYMYDLISWRMISRVFRDFKDKEETVAINLSAHDINSEIFRNKLYDELSALENASFLIFEILEDEEFRDLDVLKDFITVVRGYNIQIAIDDFGSGYSNFLELIKISPEYIKIDGTIVKNVHNNLQNRLILETIISLAKKIGAITIAEHVEHIDIYEHILAADVAYSQGFYFHKPAPLEELN